MKTVLKILKYAVAGFAASIVLSALWYLLFSLVFSTDVEKELKRENRLLSGILPEAEMAADMVESELEFLQRRDENVYRQVFKSELPHVDNMLEGKPEDVLATAGKIEENWRAVMDVLGDKGKSLPPMTLPLDDLNYTNVGASTGERMNPFYKVKVPHNGIDLVAPEGTAVRATAPGRVTKVQSSFGGSGNMVEITHPDGYVTRYAHLQAITVSSGEYVRRGRTVGLVGDSGRAFTTHLHYELLHNGETQDPVHFFFGSLTPTEYLDFLVMSVSSGQSMD